MKPPCLMPACRPSAFVLAWMAALGATAYAQMARRPPLRALGGLGALGALGPMPWLRPAGVRPGWPGPLPRATPARPEARGPLASPIPGGPRQGGRRGYIGAFRTLPFPGDDPDQHVVLKPSSRSLRSCGSCGIQPDLPMPGGWLWSVEEPDGGSIQVDGCGQARYTAPLVSRRRGFHVRATSPVDPQVFGRVALEVRPNALLALQDPETPDACGEPGLRVVAGTPGTPEEGAVRADAWSLAARFAPPYGVAWLPHTGQWLVSYPGNQVFCWLESPPEDPPSKFARDLLDWGDQAPLACPTHLAGNGQTGADWLCAIAETDQGRLRILDARGVVRPLAGEPGGHRCVWDAKHRDGPAASARFWSPEGVAMDRAGTVYVADVGNGALRRIQGGRVTTLVRTPHNDSLHQWEDCQGARPLALPAALNGALALDEAGGRLFVGVGHAVLAVALDGERQGRAEVLLGDPARPGFEAWRGDPPATLAGTPCLHWPKNLAWFRGRLYLSDHGNHALREFDPASGRLRTLAGDPGQARTRGGPLRCASPHLPAEACAALAYPLGLAFSVRGECRVATRDGVVELTGLDSQEVSADP